MEEEFLAVFTIGSYYFFKDYEEYTNQNYDEIYLVGEQSDYNNIRQVILGQTNKFYFVNRTKEEIINFALQQNITASAIGKFLIPEFNEYFGITIDDLKRLRPLVDELEEAYEYEKIIYEAYITNNSFTLTDEQRLQAFENYKSKRSQYQPKEKVYLTRDNIPEPAELDEESISNIY